MPPAPKAAKTKASRRAQSGWWLVDYHLAWPEDQPPRTHLDALIAHQILAPALAAHDARLQVWLVHRRWARDDLGHQFSFRFYSDVAARDALYRALRAPGLIRNLKRHGLVDKVVYQRRNTRPDLADLGEAFWPKELRASWPWFMTGVSRMWLGLVTAAADEALAGRGKPHTKELAEAYEEVDARVRRLWSQKANQAALHHLSGVFGYQPVLVPLRFDYFRMDGQII